MNEKHQGIASGMWESFLAQWRADHGAHNIGGETPRGLCMAFAKHCFEFLDCRLATVWSLDPVGHRLVLVAVAGIVMIEARELVMDCSKHLSGATAERKRIMMLPDVKMPDADGRTFFHPHLIDRLHLREMISIPILNTANANQLLLVVNLFPRQIQLLLPELALECAQAPVGDLFRNSHLYLLAENFALVFETCLRDRNTRLAARLNLKLSNISKDDPDRWCKALAELIKEALGCDSVAVYLQQSNALALQLRAASGDIYALDKAANLSGGPAERAWKTNRERLSLNVREDPTVRMLNRNLRKSIGDDLLVCAFVPLRDLSGQANGVIRCLNRCRSSVARDLRPFTYEDISTVEALSQAFAPHLDVILADQKRDDLFTKVAHEMRVPVVAFQAATERVEFECSRKKVRFRYDHFREIKTYTKQMEHLLHDLDIVRKGPARMILEPVPTDLESGIFAPARRFVTPILRKRGFNEHQMRYTGLDTMPQLYVDPALMTHAVFNLLENAVKYFIGPQPAFRVEIVGSVTGEHYSFIFQDLGVGVPAELGDRIFEPGVRGPNAYKYHVSGDGLGLWFVREIVNRHGGSVSILKQSRPTQFLLQLPSSLAKAPYEQ